MLKKNFEKLIYFFCVLLFSCSSSISPKKANYSKKIEYNSKVNSLDSLINSNNSKTIENYNNLQNLSNRLDSIFLKNENQNILFNKSIKNLNEQTILMDGLYKETIKNIALLEDNINILSKSYNEIAQLKINNKIEDIPPISEKEFQEKYIESLGAYQNGDMENSLDGFKYLLTIQSNYDLLDNCQYWIGEIYFKMKKYHSAIIEFEKVFDYINSNKYDDSLYKLSKCYINLNNDKQANFELNKLINNYPNSEYVKKAQLILNN